MMWKSRLQDLNPETCTVLDDSPVFGGKNKNEEEHSDTSSEYPTEGDRN